jgi:hypothetical protein
VGGGLGVGVLGAVDERRVTRAGTGPIEVCAGAGAELATAVADGVAARVAEDAAGCEATALAAGSVGGTCRRCRWCTPCVPRSAWTGCAAGGFAPDRAMPTTTTAQPATVADATTAPTIRPGFMAVPDSCHQCAM